MASIWQDGLNIVSVSTIVQGSCKDGVFLVNKPKIWVKQKETKITMK